MIKSCLKKYDDELEKYIPVLMAQARIYWDREHYPMVEKLFFQSSEFCSEHEVFHPDRGDRVRQYLLVCVFVLLTYVYCDDVQRTGLETECGACVLHARDEVQRRYPLLRPHCEAPAGLSAGCDCYSVGCVTMDNALYYGL